MRKWRNCTSLHSTVLTQEQADHNGVKVEGPFKGGTTAIQMQDSFEGVVAGSVFDSVQRWRKIEEVVGLGELFADRARVREDQRGPPGQRKSPKCQSPETGLDHVHDATVEFPQILARGSEVKGDCDDSGSIIIHRKCGQDARFSSGHTSVSCVCRLNVATWQLIVVNLATKRTSTRCVCRLNAA